VRSRWIAFARFVLFVLLFFGLLKLLTISTRPIKLSGIGAQALLGNLIVALAAIAATYVLSRFDALPFGAFGLGGPPGKIRSFSLGLGAGIALLAALLFILRMNGDFHFGGISTHGVECVQFAVLYAALFLVVAFAEETMVRGYALVKLSQSISFWPAATVLSLLFGASHLKHGAENWLGIFFASVFGFMLAWSFQRTGSLWFALGIHAGWDYAESFIFGVPDSGVVLPGALLHPHIEGPARITGGGAGPEGSIFMIIVFLALAGMIRRLRNSAAPTADTLLKGAGT
jgi:membrane protease YdiL (CAAX protease family)